MTAQLVSLDTFQVVTFSLLDSQKKENYAIPIEQIREIRATESITKVPKAKSCVKGIMNLRGSIIPIIDVKEKLGFDSGVNTDSSKQRILVAEANNSLTGLLVDEVDQVIQIQSRDIESVPQGALKSCNYVKGIAKSDKKLIVLLDASKLLGDSTSAITEAMQGGNQQ